jgi:1,4-alpha-glucan branching enzyme
MWVSRTHGQWVPNEFGGRENLDAVRFLQEMNATVYRRCPGVVTFAEESTSWPGVTKRTDAGGLGFGMKWNMGWMHDTLEYMKHEPIHRKFHHNDLTFSLVYQWSENFLLPISHDEVVRGKGSLLERSPLRLLAETGDTACVSRIHVGVPRQETLVHG